MRLFNIILSLFISVLGVCAVGMMLFHVFSDKKCGDKDRLAERPVVHKEDIGSWSYECEKDKAGRDTCYGYQRIENPKGEVVLSVRLSVVARGNDILPRLKLIAPMGTFLPTGIDLYFAKEEPFTVPFQFCLIEDNGCFINLDLGRDVTRLFRETQLFYAGYTMVGGDDIRNAVSVNGFDDVVLRLTQRFSEGQVMKEDKGD
ncbi:MAG: invasion associated locus B family protein [Alphaproteobacteria bacterium]